MRTATDHAHAPALPAGKPWLAVEHLALRYGTREVVSELSFALPQGAIACLLGPSGCGKTSVLRAILNQLRGPLVVYAGDNNPVPWLFVHWED